ncbi:peptide chain release factor 3 [Candidatus Kinetoplastidibacterium galati]|uniref:Peptide chain release factor 3 n=1 Tax=Candidatus Kinetoplastidibacterium galati TCC219 TaxID=1208921 RepID=M1LT93_9PROT|nr:peptide chain release factor 3 [Candidatus Kinetoplastibacterium galatii]AGF48737.1 peptide chain release factor RF-3 [Candidatus Kinetoplastibacterium galatii TCC219]
MKDIAKEVKRRRTFAIISHPDAGKTTLTEKILLFAGAIQIAGSVKSRKSSRYAASDWMEIEKQRGISVASSVMQIEYRDCVINLLDTPGHQDFSEDTYRVLTAVDGALMVIDAANGIESQTIRLLDICRARKTPIITFINKFDREVREPLELLSEVENNLKIEAIPFSWPIGMGKSFKGVFNLKDDKILVFKPGQETYSKPENILSNSSGDKRFNNFFAPISQEIDLIRNATPHFEQEKFINGEQTPIFFGSAINNFGVQEILDSIVDYFPSPSPVKAISRIVYPEEEKLSGLVFKIQANMDPSHRDRVAFIKINSGQFNRGMSLKNIRTKKEIKTNNVVSFLSQRREIVEEAFAGDIIGIPNHGTIHLGDVITEGEYLEFTGLPFFAPEMFCSVEPKDPLKTKQLYNGLRQLGEEGAIQVFQYYSGGPLLLGAVGKLQFEVVAHRLKNEYSADVIINTTKYNMARWVTSSNKKILDRFINSNITNIVFDITNSPALLISSGAQLRSLLELYPDIEFHKTREHNKTFAKQ